MARRTTSLSFEPLRGSEVPRALRSWWPSKASGAPPVFVWGIQTSAQGDLRLEVAGGGGGGGVDRGEAKKNYRIASHSKKGFGAWI
jgi:hypothetical protein